MIRYLLNVRNNLTNSMETETYKLIDIQQPKYHSCLWWGRRPNEGSSSQCDFAKTTTEYFINMIRNLPKDYLYFHLLYLNTGHQSVRPKHLADLDKPLLQVFENINFNSSMVVFVGDHGLHIGPFLQTKQGQTEYKLPALYINLPKWVLERYPKIKEYLTENQRRLTTHWDLHHTLKHLMTYPNRPLELIPAITYSLFEYIPHRSCHQAGIPSEFCLCNPWVTYNNKSDTNIDAI